VGTKFRFHQREEPIIVKMAGLIAACGVVVTLVVAAAGLPGPVHGLIWRTSTDAADAQVTLKVVAVVGALFVGILALGRFELSRNERRQAASALTYSEQALYEGQYNRAVLQLANKKDLVQIGGIHSLGLLYTESIRHRSIAVRALCAFIRTYPIPENQLNVTPEPIRSAITVLREFEYLPTGVELAGAHLDYVSLDGCQLYSSDFTHTSLRSATLTHVDLTWSSLRGCDLSNADIARSVFDWCNLTGANLSNVKGGNASFKAADLTDVDFRGADLRNTGFVGATWDESRPPAWPEGFQPPPRSELFSFDRLDIVRKDFLRRRMSESDAILRFSSAALREHDISYQRALARSINGPIVPHSVDSDSGRFI
jgi:hypothetical protein